LQADDIGTDDLFWPPHQSPPPRCLQDSGLPVLARCVPRCRSQFVVLVVVDRAADADLTVEGMQIIGGEGDSIVPKEVVGRNAWDNPILGECCRLAASTISFSVQIRASDISSLAPVIENGARLSCSVTDQGVCGSLVASHFSRDHSMHQCIDDSQHCSSDLAGSPANKRVRRCSFDETSPTICLAPLIADGTVGVIN